MNKNKKRFIYILSFSWGFYPKCPTSEENLQFYCKVGDFLGAWEVLRAEVYWILGVSLLCRTAPAVSDTQYYIWSNLYKYH